ncbi:MAG: D-alanyl-D-alanine carboxypeptidase [Firmicutes bacterium]|nr:D-alanyl-D-alanine carboxypeptidase [Alicyclobacillaceae bacterium]MCL6496860.1 D-alanyl-D-alanine carboxypeptidase [Bacillota bacterium]
MALWAKRLAAALLAWVGVAGATVPVRAAAAPPALSARAAVLIDARTGAILYEKDAFRQMDPASLTKMMTAYLVIRHGNLGRTVTVSKAAAQVGGSRMHLDAGDEYTVHDLLRGLLVRSGNDAAVALAEAEAGTVERFVAQMNMTAQALGAFNTQFENPNGLTAPGHVSTAYDLALIARAALNLPEFREIVRQREVAVTELRRGRRRVLHNTNLLLEAFPGADGVKTGTTTAAGKCLAASATREGQQLIAVVLKSRDRWQDAARLLQWGFDYWQTVQAVAPGQPWGTVAVRDGLRPSVAAVAARAVWTVLPRGEEPTVRVVLPATVQAPVARGQRLGQVAVLSPVEPVARSPLVAAEAVRSRGWWSWWVHWLGWLNYGDGAG